MSRARWVPLESIYIISLTWLYTKINSGINLSGKGGDRIYSKQIKKKRQHKGAINKYKVEQLRHDYVSTCRDKGAHVRRRNHRCAIFLKEKKDAVHVPLSQRSKARA